MKNKIPKYYLPIDIYDIDPTDDGRICVYVYVPFVNNTHRNRSRSEYWIDVSILCYLEDGRLDREKTYHRLNTYLQRMTYRKLSNRWDLWWNVEKLNKNNL